MSVRIGLLGCGRMGSRMAQRWLGAGHEVTVWNRDQGKARLLECRGAVVALSPEDAVKAVDVVVVMLSNGPVVEEVLFGSGLEGTIPAHATVVDMSSIPPEMARAHAQRLSARGIRYLDAPVSGGTAGAERGTLAILCGGEPKVLDSVREIFQPLGKVTLVGPHGSGQLTKLCNQVIVATTIGAVSEALLLAQAGGAVPDAVLQALEGGFADSRILREHGQRMISRDWRPGGITSYQLKDLQAARAVASAQGIGLPIMETVEQLFQELQAHGGGDWDHSALLLELERRNVPYRVGETPDQYP